MRCVPMWPPESWTHKVLTKLYSVWIQPDDPPHEPHHRPHLVGGHDPEAACKTGVSLLTTARTRAGGTRTTLRSLDAQNSTTQSNALHVSSEIELLASTN